MSEHGGRGGWVIIASFVVALALTVVPLPEWLAPWRPEFVALVLIYWCMALPARVGVGVGWLVGLLSDVLRGALLGQFALAYAVLAWIVLYQHQRIRVFPPWQQALWIFGMLGIAQLLVLWVHGIVGLAPGTWLYWASLLTSAALWPFLFGLLREVRRRYRVR